MRSLRREDKLDFCGWKRLPRSKQEEWQRLLIKNYLFPQDLSCLYKIEVGERAPGGHRW